MATHVLYCNCIQSKAAVLESDRTTLEIRFDDNLVLLSSLISKNRSWSVENTPSVVTLSQR